MKAYKTASRTKKDAKYFHCCLLFFVLFLNNGRSNDSFGFCCMENHECDSAHVSGKNESYMSLVMAAMFLLIRKEQQSEKKTT